MIFIRCNSTRVASRRRRAVSIGYWRFGDYLRMHSKGQSVGVSVRVREKERKRDRR